MYSSLKRCAQAVTFVACVLAHCWGYCNTIPILLDFKVVGTVQSDASKRAPQGSPVALTSAVFVPDFSPPVDSYVGIRWTDGSVHRFRIRRVYRHESGNTTMSGIHESGIDHHVLRLTVSNEMVSGEVAGPFGRLAVQGSKHQPEIVDLDRSNRLNAFSFEPDAIAMPVETVLQRAREAAQQKANEGERAKATPTPQSTMDVVFFYTPSMVYRYGAGLSARFDNYIAYMNDSLANSEVAITVRQLRADGLRYVETSSNTSALSSMFNHGAPSNAAYDPAFFHLGRMRAIYGADFVSTVRAYINSAHGSCGVAYLATYPTFSDPDFMVSFISDGVDINSPDANGYTYFCSNRTVAHELGHNMGLAHDRAASGGGPTAAPFAYGYGVTGSFTTVMGYRTSFNNAPDIQNYSSPNILCNGLPCGKPSTDPDAADNARALNNIRAIAAASTPTTTGIVTAIERVDGFAQTAAVGTTFALPLKLRTLDSRGVPVAGVSVSLTPPAAGPSFGVATLTSTTNSAGIATFAIGANAIAGSFEVKASVGAVAQWVSFTNF